MSEEERPMPYVTSVEEIGIEKATRTIAINCLKENIPIETIARATGLTIAQLEKLQAEAK
jgi:hypothetical protein